MHATTVSASTGERQGGDVGKKLNTDNEPRYISVILCAGLRLSTPRDVRWRCRVFEKKRNISLYNRTTTMRLWKHFGRLLVREWLYALAAKILAKFMILGKFSSMVDDGVYVLYNRTLLRKKIDIKRLHATELVTVLFHSLLCQVDTNRKTNNITARK